MLFSNVASFFQGNLGGTQFLPCVLILQLTFYVTYDSNIWGQDGWM